MNITGIEFSIIVPALIAGLLVTATHAPLGMQVLARGIVFIDIAVAQIAGVGVIAADLLGFEPAGWPVQIAALLSALGGALLLNWTEKNWPEVQEAIIGVAFILAASAAILLLAGNPHGGEHLKDLLAGQILWVGRVQLEIAALVYALILAAWFKMRERIGRVGFYVLFACAVTVSVQLVGLYLVFASLIIPPLATRRLGRKRLPAAWALGAAGYALGLALSVITDLPSGAVIVWVLAVIGILIHALIPAKLPA